MHYAHCRLSLSGGGYGCTNWSLRQQPRPYEQLRQKEVFEAIDPFDEYLNAGAAASHLPDKHEEILSALTQSEKARQKTDLAQLKRELRTSGTLGHRRLFVGSGPLRFSR